jgi:hypothetical protein
MKRTLSALGTLGILASALTAGGMSAGCGSRKSGTLGRTGGALETGGVAPSNGGATGAGGTPTSGGITGTGSGAIGSGGIGSGGAVFISSGGMTGTGGTAGRGGSGGVTTAGGSTATGGAAGKGGAAGSGGIDCSMVGCAMPPMCATGCTERCGCCPCADGTWRGNLVCRGGCWAVPDAGVDSDPAAGAFESFRLTQSFGPCPSGSDCVGYIDLDKAGQLLRDPLSSLGAPVGSASVMPAELASAIAVFTDPALVKLLDAGSPPCVPPTDIFENMKLVAGGVTHQNSTTFCDTAPVKAARDLIYQLGDKYLPSPTR